MDKYGVVGVVENNVVKVVAGAHKGHEGLVKKAGEHGELDVELDNGKLEKLHVSAVEFVR